MKDYENVRGRIFDIQKFSIHDGPGIRTIVFFKGCFLRCRWCCNPEGQSFEIETMMQRGKPKTMGRDVTVAEIMDIVCRDRPYYRRSGGGLTLSGGEVLGQPDFAAALLHAAKDRGLTTAVESTACAKYEEIQKILPYLDLYLMDIKHMDAVKHKAFTGISNERILENAQRLQKDAKHLVIRVPVILGFNDTVPEIRAIADFVKEKLPNVKELHLLPYHRLGYDKYIGLSRPYPMGDVPPPSKETMLQLLQAASATGLYCQIGG